jgi:aspartyl-tRNA(Asn)/glutamyl-tRNA(Gln) amidotransferase subunit A
MGSYCNTGIFGPARNPYDLEKSPGGSSGGNASAVSAGIAPYTLGTDTGGSTRQPASYCGIVALKPTYGSVSRYGLLTLASSFDQIAPMTSTVTDCAIVYDAICGHDPDDMMTFKRKYEPTYSQLSGEVKRLRIGISDDFLSSSSEETIESVMKAVDFYVSKGAEIVKVKLPHIKYALPIYYILGCAEISSNFGRFDGIRYGYKTSLQYKDIDDMITKTRTEGLGKDIKRRIMLGIYFLSKQNYKEYFQKASMMRNELIRDFSNAFETCDLILSPTSPTSAVSLDFTPETIVEKYYADACVAPANLCGLPALALPCGIGQNGMPIGMQLMGPNFSEGTLLNAGYAFEKECKPELKPSIGVNYDL